MPAVFVLESLTIEQKELVRHVETTLARSLFNCDEL